MTVPGVLRAKLLVARHGRAIAAVLCVVGLLALAGAGWWATHPPTTTVTDHTNERTVTTDLETGAVVASESTMYDRGDRLSNEPVYLRETAPNLTVRLRTDVTPDGEPAVVDQRLELVTQVSQDGEVFWERSRPLAGDRAEVADGNVTTAATLSISRVQRDLRAVREEVGTAGETKVFVRVTVRYETAHYEGTMTRLVPLRIGGQAYSLAPTTLSRTETQPVEREIPTPNRDPTEGAAMAALGLLALLGAGTALGGEHRLDVHVVEAELHRERFAEWISTARVGPGLGDDYVHVTSLGDLVDIGIDANKRVIHDPEMDTYAVVDDSVVYHYGSAAAWQTEEVKTTRDGGGPEEVKTARDGGRPEERKTTRDGGRPEETRTTRNGSHPAAPVERGDPLDGMDWPPASDRWARGRDNSVRTVPGIEPESSSAADVSSSDDVPDSADEFEWPLDGG